MYLFQLRKSEDGKEMQKWVRGGMKRSFINKIKNSDKKNKID